MGDKKADSLKRFQEAAARLAKVRAEKEFLERTLAEIEAEEKRRAAEGGTGGQGKP